MVNGAPGADDLPPFPSYASRRSQERPINGPSPVGPVSATSPIEGGRYYNGQRSRSNSRPRQEDFGAPLGVVRSYEERPPVPGLPPAPNRGGYGPPRGGYPPRGAMSSRGSFGSRGPPPSPFRGRGGYAPRGRGGYDPTPPGGPPDVMIPAGMNRRPPPGYGPQNPAGMDGGYGPPQGSNRNFSRPDEPGFEPPSPSIYGSEAPVGHGGLAYGSRAQSPAARRQSPYGSRAQSPVARRQSPYGSRAQSPSGGLPPQAMPPAMPPMPDQYAPTMHQRSTIGMDSDVAGMVEMQRAHPPVPHQPSAAQEYVPPRAGWQSGPSSPTHQNRRRVNSGGSDYMEDVDPKFAEPPVPPLPSTTPSAPPAEAFHENNRQHVPSILLAGHQSNPNEPSPESSDSQINNPNVINSNIPREHSYEDLHPGARSPVESETSNFTSVSQRPMNPNWQPGHPDGFNSFGPGGNRIVQERQRQRQQDILFAGNPDFELPGMGPPRSGNIRGGYRGLGRGGGGYRAPMRPPHPSVLDSMGPDGRYPSPVPPPTGMSGGGSMREV